MRRDAGSALIEAVILGSLVFLVLMAALSASLTVVLLGSEAREAARSATVHAARVADRASAEALAQRSFGAGMSQAERDGDVIRASVVSTPWLTHPHGPLRRTLVGRSSTAVAPFRSDRG